MRRGAALAVGAVTAALVLLAGGIGGSLAWDTQSVEDDEWQSMYLPATGRNEHARLSDLSLKEIGADGVLGTITGQSMMVLDLNSTLFRPALRGRGPWRSAGATPSMGTTERSPVEYRWLPPPAHAAGIPDFAYTVDDWINKDAYCPARPGESGDGACHVYGMGWLGGGFNSSHFGTQNTNSYKLLHATAMNLAARAATLRRQLKAAGPATYEAHKTKVKEAEFEALYYEGAAQHFLQDRWASGHMWERWNAPDRGQNAYGDDLIQAVEIGAMSGLIHGSEAVTKQPDAASSPFIPRLQLRGALAYDLPPAKPEDVVEMEFDLGDTGERVTGVGDERLDDMLRDKFGSDYAVMGYKDIDINVKQQRTMMFTCLGSSWAEVIAAFGPGDKTGYGSLDVPLKPGTPIGFSKVPHTCTEMWLTNRSIGLAWGADDAVALTAIARAIISPVGKAAKALFGDGGVSGSLDRASMMAVLTRVVVQSLRDPDGTDLARGGLGDLGDAKPGNAYGPPQYLRITDLTKLPERSGTGQDKEAVFGFFNQAHGDHFCTGLADRLEPLRGSKDPMRKEVCRYLAERAWSGTDDTYGGIQSEFRADAQGRPVQPFCSLMEGPARITPGTYDEATPSRLHPGYTPVRSAPQSPAAPYPMAERGISSESIANWCDKIPVLHTLNNKTDRDQDIVADDSGREEELTVAGMNLGEGGVLSLTTMGGAPMAAPTVVAWSAHSIRFRMSDLFRPGKDKLFLLSLRRSDGVESEGRFVVRTGKGPVITSVVVRQGGREVYRDEGDVARPGVFRPVGSGRTEVEIAFERPMRTRYVDGERAEFKLGPMALEGDWTSDTVWKGFGVAADPLGPLRGLQALRVKAASAGGVWIDSDPAKPGDQPDESRRLVVDYLPVYVTRYVVRPPEGTAKSFKADAGPDLERAPNLLARFFGDQPRYASRVGGGSASPRAGAARVEVMFSGPLSGEPTMTLGQVQVPLRQEGGAWVGRVDLAAIYNRGTRTTINPLERCLRLSFSGRDRAGRGLDGDPGTPTVLVLPATGTGAAPDSWWTGYEPAAVSAANAPAGGDGYGYYDCRPDRLRSNIVEVSVGDCPQCREAALRQEDLYNHEVAPIAGALEALTTFDTIARDPARLTVNSVFVRGLPPDQRQARAEQFGRDLMSVYADAICPGTPVERVASECRPRIKARYDAAMARYNQLGRLVTECRSRQCGPPPIIASRSAAPPPREPPRESFPIRPPSAPAPPRISLPAIPPPPVPRPTPERRP